MADADQRLAMENADAIIIAILDGVLYIKSKKQMYKSLTTTHLKFNVMSALVLRDFLYQL